MIVRVIISRQLLAAFRKKAIAAYPNEYMETLWGRIEGGTVLVNSLKGVEHKASPERVEYEYGDALAPAGRGELFLGSIHSHPDSTDSTPSMADWESAFSSGEHVFGVMRISKTPKGFSTETSWWEPRPMISTIHPRTRKPLWIKKPTTSESEPSSPDSPKPPTVLSDAATASTSTEKNSPPTANTQR